MNQESARPAARKTGLVVKRVGDETLVYDLDAHRAHRVNQVAAAVWRRCDGTRDAAGIAAELRAEGALVPEEAVRYALGELGHARLLATPVARVGLTRRQLMQRLGTAAAVALPVVATIVAPTAAQAQSCLSDGDPCTSDAQCCGGPLCGVPGGCSCEGVLGAMICAP